MSHLATPNVGGNVGGPASRANALHQETPPERGFSESRRADSNRGPLHYEGRTSEGRASIRGRARARSSWKSNSFTSLGVDTHARQCPRSRTRFVPVLAAVVEAWIERLRDP